MENMFDLFLRQRAGEQHWIPEKIVALAKCIVE